MEKNKMKLTNDQKEIIETYLKHNVLYEKLTHELICKTIYELYDLLKIPNLQIFYKPYFGSCADPCQTGRTDTFTLVFAFRNNETTYYNLYTAIVDAVSELPTVSIKEQ